MANGKIKESVYGEDQDLGTRTIDVTFIKNISSAKDWNSINREIKVQYLLSELPEQKKRKKSNKEQNVSK